jgi:hypothetical protein
VNDLRAWAAWYWDALGWCVIPAHGVYRLEPEKLGCACGKAACDKPGKHPKARWGADIPLTVLADGWGHAQPTDNLALLTGKRSGVVVADIDPRHGGALEPLWRLGWSQNTPIARSGGGGWHVYAAYPPDGLRSVDAYAPGTELKADGKYVIAPPSLHIARRRYCWLPDHAPWDCAPAPLPDTVLAALAKRTTTVTLGEAQPARDDPHALVYSLVETQRIATALIHKALRRVADGEGRNNTAFWLGRQLDSLGLTRREVATLVALYGLAAQHG